MTQIADEQVKLFLQGMVNGGTLTPGHYVIGDPEEVIRGGLEAALSARATPPEEVVHVHSWDRTAWSGSIGKPTTEYFRCGAFGCEARMTLDHVLPRDKSKVSSEAPVDGACAPSIEELTVADENMMKSMVGWGVQALLNSEGMLNARVVKNVWDAMAKRLNDERLDLTRHKPRPTPPDLPIKYQRNVGGVQTLSFCTRKIERRQFINMSWAGPGTKVCYETAPNKLEVCRRNHSRRASPKGAA